MGNIMLSYWYKLYNSQTDCEQRVEMEIAKFGVRYRTQHPFLAKKAFVDFIFLDHNLVVEVDDPSHEEPTKKAKDLQRTKALQTLGLRVIRFTNYEVRNSLEWVISQIREELFTKRGLEQPYPFAQEDSQSTPEPKATGTPGRSRKSSSKPKASTSSRR